MTSRSIGIWVRNLTLLAVIAAFVVFFGPQSQQGEGGGDSVGSVNGEPLSRALFYLLRDQRSEQEQQLRDQGVPAQTVRELIDRQVFEQMVQRRLLAQAAEARGFEVSDSELRASVCDQFRRPDGSCDVETFRSWVLNSLRMPDERDYFEATRQDLLIAKLRRYLSGPLRTSEAAARDRIVRDQTQLRLAYVAVDREGDPELEAPDEEIQALIADGTERIAQEYERRLAEFQQPEQIRARHILFTGEDAESQAQAALARLEAGEAFEALATELSQDRATSRAGGDLGFFPRGRVSPELEEAAFSAEVGVVSGPVETPRGVHLIRVEERREAIDRSIADVQEELARELWIRDRTSAQALETASALIRDLADGASLEEAAQERGLSVEQTPEFPAMAQAVPGLPAMEGLRETALTLTPERSFAPRPFEALDAYYVVALTQRTPPDPERVEEQVDRMRTMWTNDAQTRVLSEIYTESREEAQVLSFLDDL